MTLIPMPYHQLGLKHILFSSPLLGVQILLLSTIALDQHGVQCVPVDLLCLQLRLQKLELISEWNQLLLLKAPH